MESDDPSDSVEILEQALRGSGEKHYILRLYVAGLSARSRRAIENLEAICQEHLKGRFELEVIDIHQQPSVAQGAQIVAIRTLIKKLPPPLRKFMGTWPIRRRSWWASI